MKFFHLSDLHFGKHLHHYNLKEDQRHIAEEIVAYAKKLRPDAVIIAGDVYDKSAPSAEAVTLFDSFLSGLAAIEPAIPVLVIGGNHDSGERLDYAKTILKQQNIYLSGTLPGSEEEHLQQVVLEDGWGEVHIYLLPFFKPSYVRKLPGLEQADYTEALAALLAREEIDWKQRNVLVSHQFFTGNGQTPQTCDSEVIYVGGVDNVDISPVLDFDYVALGHIHGAQQVGQPYIRYCGTPLKYSVSEASHKKSLTVVTLEEKGKPPLIETLPLHPLYDVKKKTGTLEELLEEGKQKPCLDYVSITLTDEGELYKPRERLDAVYPRILEIRLDNARTRSQLEAEEEHIEMKNPVEMFLDFYYEVQKKEVSAKGREILENVFEEIRREDV